MPSADRSTETDDTVHPRPYMVHARPVDNTAALFGFFAIALVAVIGATIDVSRITIARQDLKQRLDAALVAGTSESGPSRRVLAEDVFDAMPTGSIARSTTRRFEADPSGISGVVTAAVPTTLSRMLGIRSVRITARGRATAPARMCEDAAMADRSAARCAPTITSSTRAAPQP